MSDTPTHPELCENCNPLVESSKLEWVKVGGMNIGLHRQPLTWVLRDKYSDDVIKMNAEYSQQLAAKSRELADMTARLTTITEQRDELEKALGEIKRTEPANYNGDLFYPRYTEDGDWAGDEPVDPYGLLAFIYPRISEALQSLNQPTEL